MTKVNQRALNKAKKIEADEHDHKLSQLANELEKLKAQKLPTPKYFYKVGNTVKYRIGDTQFKIVEILENGKILKVQTNDNDKYGRYESHLEIMPLGVEEKTNFAIDLSNSRNINFASTPIETLISFYYNAGINDCPDYQRPLCWSLENKVRLIDSIFNKVEIGKFPLIRSEDGASDDRYELLDGKQRLNAIIGFYEDQFPYRGKYFSQLSKRDKRHFIDFPVAYAQIDPLTELEKLEYFVRMNFEGVPQSPEHLDKIKSRIKEIKAKK